MWRLHAQEKTKAIEDGALGAARQVGETNVVLHEDSSQENLVTQHRLGAICVSSIYIP